MREMYVRQVRAELGEPAGHQARIALVWRGLGTVGLVGAGVWVVILVVGTVMAWAGDDEHDYLLSQRWWGWLITTVVLAVVGFLCRALSGRWSRRALGDRADEIKIVDESFRD